MKSIDKSLELNERLLRITPGPQSNLRGWTREEKLMFMVKGKGARLWDVDGNEYVDYTAGFGPGILGYANAEYNEALKLQLDTLTYLVMSASPLLVELGEKFVQHVPCAENVRFLLSGTEAVQMAIRLARAYTKRRYFIRFEGHYHGWLDNVLGGIVNDHPNGKPFALETVDDPAGTEGRDPTAFEQSFKLPWNDIDILEKVLEKYGEEVALIHMEPILCNGCCCHPLPGYLEKVRELCTKYGIVLSFDEVITGFRVGLNSAQGKLGVTPDLSTFGKAIAGGIPLSAIAGKIDIFNLIMEGRVASAGTFNGYPLALAAAVTTIKILERGNGALYKHIDKMQNRLMIGLREISKRHGIPLLVQGPTGVFVCEFIDKEVTYCFRDLKEADTERQKKFRDLMFEEGVMTLKPCRLFVSAAHTEADIDRTLECAERVMARL